MAAVEEGRKKKGRGEDDDDDNDDDDDERQSRAEVIKRYWEDWWRWCWKARHRNCMNDDGG